jgi:hypothetical protein
VFGAEPAATPFIDATPCLLVARSKRVRLALNKIPIVGDFAGMRGTSLSSPSSVRRMIRPHRLRASPRAQMIAPGAVFLATGIGFVAQEVAHPDGTEKGVANAKSFWDEVQS